MTHVRNTSLPQHPTSRPGRALIGRRQLMIGMGSGAAIAAVPGCGFFSTDPEAEPSPTDAPDADLKEAPDLAAQVEAGTLPPLEERLPANPVVVEPVDRLGSYGGTWTTAMTGASAGADSAWLRRTIGYEPLLRWDPEWTAAIPNVAEAVEQSADGSEFVITLRAGMKWSDGTPFTADDLVFAYEDVLLNEELFPVVPGDLTVGGEVATLEKMDDHTVRISFAAPNGVFIEQLALSISGSRLIVRPRHHLEQFHAAYNNDADSLADDAGFGSWAEHFLARANRFQNADMPTLWAWRLTSAPGDSTTVVAERNPYYWKTDPEGRQLPYIDTVSYEVVSDPEVMLLNATEGQYGLHTRHINSLGNKPVLAESREDGNYEFLTLESSFMNEMVIFFNLTHTDAVKREIFNNKDFRVGLSHAIDRDELNKTEVFEEEGEAWQAAPTPASRFFDEEMATQFTEFNVDLANEALDRAGYADRDDDGIRLGPDGEPISFEIEVSEPGVVPWNDAINLVAGYWRDVGIDARTRNEDRSLFVERTIANEHDAGIWVGPGGRGDETRRPFFYLPTMVRLQAFAPLWAQWNNDPDGSTAEEPPEPTRQQFELFAQLALTPDEAERDDLFRQILAIAKEQFYVIGTLRVAEGYGIVRNDFHNVPESMPASSDFETPAPTNPCQYFIE